MRSGQITWSCLLFQKSSQSANNGPPCVAHNESGAEIDSFRAPRARKREALPRRRIPQLCSWPSSVEAGPRLHCNAQQSETHLTASASSSVQFTSHARSRGQRHRVIQSSPWFPHPFNLPQSLACVTDAPSHASASPVPLPLRLPAAFLHSDRSMLRAGRFAQFTLPVLAMRRHGTQRAQLPRIHKRLGVVSTALLVLRRVGTQCTRLSGATQEGVHRV